MAHTLQDRFGKMIAAKLRASLVTKDNVIFNTYYEGDPKAGAVKIPVRDNEVSIGSYSTTNVGSNSLNYGSTTYITSTIDNDKFVNEYIDGYEAEAVPDGIIADRLDSAGYSLAADEDQNGLDTLVSGIRGYQKGTSTAFASGDPRNGKTGTIKAMAALDTATTGDRLNATTAYNWAVELGKALDEANVPDGGRYLICDPTAYAYLIQDDNFIRYGDLSQEIKQTGAVGMVNGMAVYKSNRLGNGADITISSTAYYGKVAMLAGHPNYATRVDEWKVEPKLVDLNGDANVVGGSAVKGRWVYTHEVIKPQAFAMLTRPVAKS